MIFHHSTHRSAVLEPPIGWDNSKDESTESGSDPSELVSTSPNWYGM